MTDFIARTYTTSVSGETILKEEYDPNNFKYENVIDFLNKNTFKFAWETTMEQAITNELHVIEVNVYVPGFVLHGRAFYDLKNYETAHLRAIEDAIKYLKVANTNTENNPVKQEKPEIKNSNDILDELINNNQISEKEEKTQPKEEVPFDEYVNQNRGLKDFSEEEKNRMKALKAKGYDLDKMVNSWKPELKKSTDLTTKTIGDFLKWVEQLEKSQC